LPRVNGILTLRSEAELFEPQNRRSVRTGAAVATVGPPRPGRKIGGRFSKMSYEKIMENQIPVVAMGERKVENLPKVFLVDGKTALELDL